MRLLPARVDSCRFSDPAQHATGLQLQRTAQRSQSFCYITYLVSAFPFLFSFRFLLTPVPDPFGVTTYVVCRPAVVAISFIYPSHISTSHKPTERSETRKTDVLSGVCRDSVYSLSFPLYIFSLLFSFSSFARVHMRADLIVWTRISAWVRKNRAAQQMGTA
jgi:hypothetical protein